MHPRCPDCKTTHVRRAHRVGAFEHLLSLVFVYPFRCQLCAHRFTAMEWGTRYARKSHHDRRQFERTATKLPATFTGSQLRGQGVVTSISAGGCHLETDATMIEGAQVQLQVQLSPGMPAVVIDQAVVRSIGSSGIGVRFDRLQPEEKTRLGQFVQGLLSMRFPRGRLGRPQL